MRVPFKKTELSGGVFGVCWMMTNVHATEAAATGRIKGDRIVFFSCIAQLSSVESMGVI